LARKPIPTWYFAAVVVRHGDRFLLVQERKHDEAWYLPAGRVEPGESLLEAAARETFEESGVDVRLIGLLRIEHTVRRRSARLRVFFLAEPRGDTRTKQEADRESLGAAWVSVEELSRYRLRGPEVAEMIRYVADGGMAYPLEILQREGMPYRRGPRITSARRGDGAGVLARLRRSLAIVLTRKAKN
jgi:phosphatase NudJ